MSYKSSSTLNDCTSLPEAPMPEKMQKVWPSPTSMAQSARSMSHARHRRLPEPTAGEQRSLRLPRSRSDVCSSSGQHFDSVLSDPVVPAASHRDIGSSIDSVGALRCNSPPMQPRPPTPETMEWVSSGGFWMDCSYLIDCAQVVESLPDRFTCQVCGMLDLNVLDPKCGGHHPFCRSCLHDWHQRCVSKGEPVLCPTCQREISRSEWALQTDATELRELQVECPECEAEGVTFQCAFKDLPTHWRSGTCAGSLVACPLKDAGCRYTCVESLAHEHRVLEQESHLKLLMSAFSGGKETALKLEAELRRERDAADCLRRQLQSSNPLSYCLATQVPLPFLVSFGPARYSSLVDVHYFCTETSSWVPAAKYGFQQSPLNKPHPSTADSKVLFTVVPFSGRLAADRTVTTFYAIVGGVLGLPPEESLTATKPLRQRLRWLVSSCGRPVSGETEDLQVEASVELLQLDLLGQQVTTSHYLMRPLRVRRLAPAAFVFAHAQLTRSYLLVVGGYRLLSPPSSGCCWTSSPASQTSSGCVHGSLPPFYSVPSFEVSSMSASVDWTARSAVDSPVTPSAVTWALEESSAWRIYPIPPWVGAVAQGIVADASALLITALPRAAESLATRLLRCPCDMFSRIRRALSVRKRLFVVPLKLGSKVEAPSTGLVSFNVLDFLKQIDTADNQSYRPGMTWRCLSVPQTPPHNVCLDIAKECYCNPSLPWVYTVDVINVFCTRDGHVSTVDVRALALITAAESGSAKTFLTIMRVAGDGLAFISSPAQIHQAFQQYLTIQSVHVPSLPSLTTWVSSVADVRKGLQNESESLVKPGSEPVVGEDVYALWI